LVINATKNFPFVSGWSITLNKRLAMKILPLMEEEYKLLGATHFVFEDIWFGYVMSKMTNNITIVNDRTGYNIYGKASSNASDLEDRLYPHIHSSNIMHHANLSIARNYFVRHPASRSTIRHDQEYNRDFWIVTNPGRKD